MTLIRGDLSHTVETAKLPSGLLDHIDPINRDIWGLTEGIARSFNCIDVDVLPGPCVVLPGEDPIDPPEADAEQGADEGELEDGTYYVAVTATNENGETNATPIGVPVTVDSALASPDPTAEQSSTGDLDAGVYYVGVSALNDHGETLAGVTSAAVVVDPPLDPPSGVAALATALEDSEIPPGTYFVGVAAEDGHGTTTVSTPASVTVGVDQGILVENYATAGATRYAIFIGPDADNLIFQVFTSATNQTFGAYSDTGTPPPPENTTGGPPGALSVSWPPISGAQSYHVYVGDAPDDLAQLGADAVSPLIWSGFETLGGPPPDENTTDGPLGSIEIVWDSVDGAEGYNVYGGTSQNALGLIEADATSPVVWSDGDFDPLIPLPTQNTTGTDSSPVEKIFGSVEIINGAAATVQAGLLCGVFGLSESEAEAELTKVFERRETKGVERAFAENVFAGAVDLTPNSGPVSHDQALSTLEGYAANAYSGRAFLHAPPTLASLLLNRKRAKLDENDLAWTRFGSALVNGAGYDYPSLGPTGEPAEDGVVWLYATGKPVAARGRLVMHSTFDQYHNDTLALAERPYVLGVDCFVAAIQVSLEA